MATSSGAEGLFVDAINTSTVNNALGKMTRYHALESPAQLQLSPRFRGRTAASGRQREDWRYRTFAVFVRCLCGNPVSKRGVSEVRVFAGMRLDMPRSGVTPVDPIRTPAASSRTAGQKSREPNLAKQKSGFGGGVADFT